MRLKLIVASMFAAGLASGAMAASYVPEGDSLTAKIAKMEEALKQNHTGYFYNQRDWFNRISVSGQINADAIYSNRVPTTFTDKSYSLLNLSNANLFIDALVNDWTRTHISLAYQDYREVNTGFSSNSQLSETLSPISSVSPIKRRPGSSGLTVEEAYINIGDFVRNPFYATLGKQYVDFGDYVLYPMQDSLPQLLSETRGTSALVGFSHPSGFAASVFALSGLDDTTDTGVRNRVRNYGGKIGFSDTVESFKYRVGLSYLRNMADVNFIANNLSTGGYTDEISAIGVNGDISTGPFDLGGRYVSALTSFNSADVQLPSGAGAKPRAFEVTAGYSFPVMEHQSRFGLGYQSSYESASNSGFGVGGIGLPERRYEANYVVNVARWADVGVDLVHDRDYSVADGGTGSSATVGMLRLGVKFA